MMMYSKRFNNLTPYTAGEQPKDRQFIKLNTNEAPYPPCPEVGTLLRNLNINELRLYPDPEASELRTAIAEVEGVSPGQIFPSNGSDEALSFCFYAFFDGSRGPVLFPEFTYSFYPVYCTFYDIPFSKVPMKSDFSIDTDRFSKLLPESCGAIFPNPNAPTGIFQKFSEIEAILKSANEEKQKAVIIDEAYIDFAGESTVALLESYPNLLVVKTYSKGRGLAGIRLGYVVASEEIATALGRVKDSFNSYPIDRLTQKIGIAAIQSRAYYREIHDKIIATRKRTAAELDKLGWNVLPSGSNFLFVENQSIPGEEVYKKFREKGILVRHFRQRGISNFIRVTIGTDNEMDTFLQICEEIQ